MANSRSFATLRSTFFRCRHGRMRTIELGTRGIRNQPTARDRSDHHNSEKASRQATGAAGGRERLGKSGDRTAMDPTFANRKVSILEQTGPIPIG
jgi:hypothetical protein